MASCPDCGFEIPDRRGCQECGYGRQVPLVSASGTAAGGAERAPVITKRFIDISVIGALLPILALLTGGTLIFAFTQGLARESVIPFGLPQDPAIAWLDAGALRPAAEGFPSAEVVLFSGIRNPFDIRTRKDHPPLQDEKTYLAWMQARTREEERFLRGRWARSRALIARRDAAHDKTLAAFLRTPREFFCRPYNLPRVYEDAALAIGFGQTISGPHIVTRMTDSLNLRPEHKVLEIGTGSGYQSALLAELANHVFTIEIVQPLAEQTDAIYRRHSSRYPQYTNIRRKVGDGYYGWEEYAPFDRIIVTCGIDHIPPPLLNQLAPAGIMVIPVGPPTGQTVLKVVKEIGPDGLTLFSREDIYHGQAKKIFVPFTSKEGGVHSIQEP